DLDAHLDRLYAGAAALSLHVMPRVGLRSTVDATLAEARHAPESRIRIVATRGAGRLGARLDELAAGRTIVIVEPLPPQPTEVALAIVDWPLPRRARCGVKALAYLDHVLARELAAAAGADEAVRLDADGHVAECATSNVFVVAGDHVITPPAEHGV